MKDNSTICLVIVIFLLMGVLIGLHTAPNDDITESGLVIRKIRLSRTQEGMKYYTVTTKNGNDFEFASKSSYSIGDTLDLKVRNASKKSTFLETKENKTSDDNGSD